MDNNLRQGDIIIFKAEEDALSKAIAWLTDSDVSHSAMVYDENHIVETIANGVTLHQFKPCNGNSAYVLRLKSQPDPAPLVKTAHDYLESGTKYDFPSLIFLGGLLLYRKIHPTKKFLSITKRLIQAACVELDHFIQKILLKNPDGAMVCSQFVYQVYYDCGGDYRIIIQNGTFSSSRKNTADMVQEGAAEGTVILADLLKTRSWDMAASLNTVDPSLADVKADSNSLIQELYHNLEIIQHDEAAATNALPAHYDSVLPVAHTFLTKLEKLVEILGLNMPVDAMFITPADLVYHAVNLTQVGELEVVRI